MQVWKSHQQRFFDERQEDDLHLGGDCRCDSPGFSAKYGSYSLMDMECSKVLDMQLVQVSTAYLRTKLFHLQIMLNQCVNQIDKGGKKVVHSFFSATRSPVQTRWSWKVSIVV